MTRKFCDVCGKEVITPHPMSNAKFPVYTITKMIKPFCLSEAAVKVDLCDEHEKALEEFLAPKEASA